MSSSFDHHRTRRTRRGFTLIEMLVVIAIIATLAAVVAPNVFRNVGDAQTTAAKTQIAMIGLALDSYRMDIHTYPTDDEGLGALQTPPTTSEGVANWRGPYLLRAIPADPWGRPYLYRSPGQANPRRFDLYSLGRDGQIGGTDEDADITSWGGPVAP